MRVTERAQHAVLDAKQEAGRLGHDRVGTEHLLLGLLRDQESLAVVTLAGLGIQVETVRRRVEETVGRGQGPQVMGFYLPMTKPATLVLSLAGSEAMRLDHDRLGTEHLLLGVASEGEGVAARVLQELGAGLLELREAVAAQYAAGVDPEPFPPDRGPPPWEPPAGARLRRVVPLAQEFPLPSGDQLVLLSLEAWSDWLDLRYAVVYATRSRKGSCHARRSSAAARCRIGPAPPTPPPTAPPPTTGWCASPSASSSPRRRTAPTSWSGGSARPAGPRGRCSSSPRSICGRRAKRTASTPPD
jgi:hypothetical protein